MYQLIIANKNYSSWSLRPWILLTACGIEFTEVLEHFIDGGSYDDFRRFSPTGLVPCLLDDETVVWDSLAICEYIAEDFPHVLPADRKARAWARSASAEMHSGYTALRSICSMNIGLRIRLHETSPALAKDLVRLSEVWNEGLEIFGGRFLTGDSFSLVDAFFAPVVFRLQTYGLTLDGPAQDYADRILQHPAMRIWEQQALQETMREPTHEKDFYLLGEVLEDLRATV